MRFFPVKVLTNLSLSGAFLVGAISVVAQQSTANLGGKVFDSQGKIVQGASIDLTSQETGNQWHVKTNRAGDWIVQSLVPGHYTFTVFDSGFKKAEHDAIELQVADQKYVDTTLQVGGGNETVVVSAETPLIDTTGAVSGTVITQAQLEEIPSLTNSPTDLIRLAPGATVALPTGGGAHLWSNNSETTNNVNNSGSGGGSYNVSYQIEGGTDTNGGGQIAFIPPMDAVSEFRVSTNAYDASIGRVTAATIDMAIKSGAKSFHGSGYEFYQTKLLNAKPYSNGSTVPIPSIHTHEFGGTFGGPIWIPKVFDGRKQHTFFFVSYDGIRNTSPATTSIYLNVPTAAERGGDFSQSFITNTTLGAGPFPVQVYDPLTANPTTGARSLFPGNIIPASRISPVAKAIYALLPLPNNPVPTTAANDETNNYIRNEPKIDLFNSYIGRLDKAFNEKNHTYVEYRYNHLVETSGDPFGPTNVLDTQQLLRTNWGLTADHAWVLSPNFLLTFHGNATWWQTSNVELAYGVDPTKFGFSSAVAGLSAIPSLPELSGIGSGYENGGYGTAIAPTFTNDALYEGRITATQTLGNNSIKYGAEYLIQQEAKNNLGTPAGNFSFGSNWTEQYAGTTTSGAQSNNSIENIAAFDLGMPTGGSVPTNATSFFSQPFMGFFVQDDYRVTSRLTLNLGLRWDYQEGLTDRHDRFFSNFDPNAIDTGVTASAQPAYATVLSGSSTNAGVQFLQQYRPNASTFVAKGQVQYAGLNGQSRDVTQTSKRYFQPRLGFAYRIHPNTVIRGGLGRFVQANFLTGLANQAGYSNSTTYDATNDNYFTQASTLANPFPTGQIPVTGNSAGGLTQVGSFSSFNQPRTPRTYVDEVSVHLEQQIHDWVFELGSSLNITRALGIGYNINTPSTQQWIAANTPIFDSTGRPSVTLPGNVTVANPFHNAPNITGTLSTNTTIGAYQLALPNPLFNGLTETFFNATNDYYGMTARAERRFKNGFGLLTTFAWSKDMYNGNLPQNQAVSQQLFRELSSGDIRFINNINPTYVLPFGRGKLIGGHVNRWTDLVIGGWELSGIFTRNSGTPVSLPTNSAFFEGGDPGSNFVKTRQHQFDTSKFAPFPGTSTPLATLANSTIYPAWTGVLSLPGASFVPTAADVKNGTQLNGVYQDFATWRTRNPVYFGDVRNPPYVNLDAGLRKNLPIREQMRLELRIDAFNAANHPVFSGPGNTAGSSGFGYLSNSPTTLSQSNTPRAFQLSGKFYF